MKYRFDPTHRLIVVDASIDGPFGRISIPMALDTGATRTQIVPKVLTAIGYDLSEKLDRVHLSTANGIVGRYRITIQQISALGQSNTNCNIVVGELPAKSGIQGLLGLDHFRSLHLAINFKKGTITLRHSHWWF